MTGLRTSLLESLRRWNLSNAKNARPTEDLEAIFKKNLLISLIRYVRKCYCIVQF